jgi:hypothetical protein
MASMGNDVQLNPVEIAIATTMLVAVVLVAACNELDRWLSGPSPAFTYLGGAK